MSSSNAGGGTNTHIQPKRCVSKDRSAYVCRRRIARRQHLKRLSRRSPEKFSLGGVVSHLACYIPGTPEYIFTVLRNYHHRYEGYEVQGHTSSYVRHPPEDFCIVDINPFRIALPLWRQNNLKLQSDLRFCTAKGLSLTLFELQNKAKQKLGDTRAYLYTK